MSHALSSDGISGQSSRSFFDSLSKVSSTRWVLLGLTLLFIVVFIQYVGKTSNDQNPYRSAFSRWRPKLVELVQGGNPYLVDPYPNAPIQGLILYPISLLPRVKALQITWDTGAMVWFILKVGMTILSFFWIVRLVEENGIQFPSWAQVLTLLFSLRAIIGDLSHGNVNLLILFLVVASLRLFHRRRDFLSGIVLALAITCKVTPLLFVAYFAWKRAWKALIGTAAGLILFFAVVPSLFLGVARNYELTKTWFDQMILPFTVRGEVTTEHMNQSIPGLLYRMLTASPSFLDEDDQPVAYHNFVSLDSTSVRWMVKLLGFLFLGLMVWRCRHSIQSNRASWMLASEYAIIVLGMLLFSERTWKHHCVTLVLPYAVVFYALATFQMSVAKRGTMIGLLLGSLLLMATTSTTLWEWLGNYREGAKLAQVYGAYVWAEMALLLAVVLSQLTMFPTRTGIKGSQ